MMSLADLLERLDGLTAVMERVAAGLEQQHGDQLDEWLTDEQFEEITKLPVRYLDEHPDLPFLVRPSPRRRLIRRRELHRWMQTRR
jgi:hypothetical protein